jgi:hypothetical protein
MRPPTEAASLELRNQVSPPIEGAIFPRSGIRRKVISQRQSDGEVQCDETGDNDPCDIRHGKIPTQHPEICQYLPECMAAKQSGLILITGNH